MKAEYKKTNYCEHATYCDKDRPCFDTENGDDCPFFEHTKDFTSIRGKQVTKDD